MFFVGALSFSSDLRPLKGARTMRSIIASLAPFILHRMFRSALWSWVFAVSRGALAGTIIANPSGTIQAAIETARDGDIVIARPGTYRENINVLGKNIVLRSNNPEDNTITAATIIDGDYRGPVVTFSGGETSLCGLAGFTLTRGSAEHGGGIQGNKTMATIQLNRIYNCRAHEGGGIYDCDGLILNNWIYENVAMYGAGLYGCDGLVSNNIILRNNFLLFDYQSEALNGPAGYMCNGVFHQNVVLDNRGSPFPGLGFSSADIRNTIFYGQRGGDPAFSGTVWDDLGPWNDNLAYSFSIHGMRGDRPTIIFRSQGPSFADDTYILASDSICIDAGDPQYCDGPAKGCGSERSDLGAYGGPFGDWKFLLGATSQNIVSIILAGYGNIQAADLNGDQAVDIADVVLAIRRR